MDEVQEVIFSLASKPLNINLILSRLMGSSTQLSICIPTFNRSNLLRDSLNIIIPQIRGFGDRIELLVGDNCSTDDTQVMVEEMSKDYPIKYYKNDINYGANQNILFFMQARAQGEYCWILGDDDHVREEGENPSIGIILCADRDLDPLISATG